MAFIRRLAALAGAAEVARRYAQKNPEKAGRFLDQAAAFVDKQTKGKYSTQIHNVTTKAKGAAGIRSAGPARPAQPFGQHPGYGKGTTPPAAPGEAPHS